MLVTAPLSQWCSKGGGMFIVCCVVVFSNKDLQFIKKKKKMQTSSHCGCGMLESIPRLIRLNSLVFISFPFFTLYLHFGFLIPNLLLLHIKKKTMWLFPHHFLLSSKLHFCISNWVDEMMYLMCSTIA